MYDNNLGVFAAVTALVFLMALGCCDIDGSVLSQGEKCGVAGVRVL